MPYYVCISCHRTQYLDTHPAAPVGCTWCRQRLVHFGRESASLSPNARALHPSDAPDHEWRGIRSHTIANVMPDPAVLEAETILVTRPDHPEALLYLARRAKTDREWVRATGYLNRLSRLFPDDRQIAHDIAEVALLGGDSKAAVDALSAILVQDSKDATAHYNMAIALHRIGGDLSRVITHLQACVSLVSDSDLARAAQSLLDSIGSRK